MGSSILEGKFLACVSGIKLPFGTKGVTGDQKTDDAHVIHQPFSSTGPSKNFIPVGYTTVLMCFGNDDLGDQWGQPFWLAYCKVSPASS